MELARWAGPSEWVRHRVVNLPLCFRQLSPQVRSEPAEARRCCDHLRPSLRQRLSRRGLETKGWCLGCCWVTPIPRHGRMDDGSHRHRPWRTSRSSPRSSRLGRDALPSRCSRRVPGHVQERWESRLIAPRLVCHAVAEPPSRPHRRRAARAVLRVGDD